MLESEQSLSASASRYWQLCATTSSDDAAYTPATGYHRTDGVDPPSSQRLLMWQTLADLLVVYRPGWPDRCYAKGKSLMQHPVRTTSREAKRRLASVCDSMSGPCSPHFGSDVEHLACF